MQQSRFAQRELVDDRARGCAFGGHRSLSWIRAVSTCEEFSDAAAFLPNPTIPAFHRAKHHVILMERPVNALRLDL